MKKRMSVFMLLLSFGLYGCTGSVSNNSSNLMDNIKKNDLAAIEISGSENQASINKEIIDFSLDLFNESFEEENILISPLSIASALGMVANGAKGNTLSQMEDLLNSDIQGLNDYLKAYREYLPNSEEYKVSLANSIWFKDKEGLTVDQDFLQTNKDYYDADIYKAPFDKTTKDDINNWVEDKTQGMIEKLLDEAPSDQAIMYLINALSFEAEWEDIYEKNNIYEDYFTLEKGEKQAAEFMASSEYSYLQNENSTGFIKPYKDGKYAFLALLPKENLSMKDLINSLDGIAIMNLIENEKEEKIDVQIPKFSMEYNTLLNNPLQDLGMVDGFDGENADFTGLGKSTDGNIYVSRVIHKTKIDVDEKGTKAGAVTSVEMKEMAMIETPKEVILNRPFFYMIIDTEQNLPLFMGSLMNVN